MFINFSFQTECSYESNRIYSSDLNKVYECYWISLNVADKLFWKTVLLQVSVRHKWYQLMDENTSQAVVEGYKQYWPFNKSFRQIIDMLGYSRFIIFNLQEIVL